MNARKQSRHRLVLIRHAKSDWSTGGSDLDRPLSSRGRRQAPESGAWLAANVPIDAAVVSPAERARSTWKLVAATYDEVPPTTHDERAYTFDGRALLDIVRELDESLGTVALVGHNPAMEELVHLLTRRWLAMPTTCVAVVELPGAWSDAPGASVTGGTVVAYGRPPTEV